MIYPVTGRCNKLVPSRRLLADCVSYLVCVCEGLFCARLDPTGYLRSYSGGW